MAEKVSILVTIKDGASKTLGGIRGAFGSLTKKAMGFITPQNLIIAGFTALAAGVVKTVRTLANLQTKMVNVGNLTGASRAEVNKMTEDLVKLSGKIPQSVDNLAESLFDVVSAGVPAAESIAFLETAGKLATAGVTNTKVAVDGLTSVMNAFGMEASDATMISDKFFAAQQMGKTNIAQLASSIGQVAPIAAGLGVSFDELVSQMSTVTLSGIKTSEAATGLKAVLSNLLKPSEQAAETAKLLRIEFDANAVQSKKLTGVLKDVIDKTGGSKVALGQLFGSMEAVNTILALSKNNFEKLNEVQEHVADSSGRMEEAFKENMNTLSVQWQLIKNNSIVLGKTLLNWLIPVITKTLGAFNKLFKSTQKGFKLAGKGIRKFTSLFKLSQEEQVAFIKETEKEKTAVQKDEELERLKNYQEEKAAEVETLLATAGEKEKIRKKEHKKEMSLRKEEEKAFQNMMRLRDEAIIKERAIHEARMKYLSDFGDNFRENIVAQFREGELKAVDFGKAAEKAFDNLKAQILDQALQSGLNNLIGALKGDFEFGGKPGEVGWGGELGRDAAGVIGELVEEIPIIGGAVAKAGQIFLDFLGFANGGIVPGTSFTGDKVPAMMNSGELVLNAKQQRNIGELIFNVANNPGKMASNSGMEQSLQRIEQALMMPQRVEFDGDSLTRGVIKRQKRLLRTGQISTKG